MLSDQSNSPLQHAPDPGSSSDPNSVDRSRVILGLMAKYWTPGRVKTRLGAAVGMAAAAAIHYRFTTHLCQNLRDIGTNRELCFAPETYQGEFQQALHDLQLGACWSLVPQGEGDLGDRMSRWFRRNLAAKDPQANQDAMSELSPAYHGAVLIGADCPTLSPHTIASAATLLEENDLVLGPAVDGGYYLIGLRRPWRNSMTSLFENMPWSKPAVFEITRLRAQQAGLTLQELPLAEDVDTITELEHLLQQLNGEDDSSPHACLKEEIQRVLANTSDGTPH
ncbi:MAG: TIGR04282 family arsenosugar biosynthesis glycosyltransferase [Pirellulales bacterium]|nr:TIGR04282 family arsenosugar biosynthesis glycosyltransferase [Pirellulales bacterium]